MILIANKFPSKDVVGAMFMTASEVLTIIMVFVLLVPSSSLSTKTPLSKGTSLFLPTILGSRELSLSTRNDFGDFNKIFENASILISKEFEVSEQVAFVDLDVSIRNIICYDLSVGNISVDHEQESDTKYLVTVGAAKLNLTCEMNYDYSYGILSGDGWVQIQTENSEVSSSIMFASLDFNQSPPTSSEIENCVFNVEIKHLNFEEDFASEILEIFQKLVRNTVEGAIANVACEELSVIGTNMVRNMVDIAVDQLEPYLGYLGESVTDPLYLEHNFILPDSLEALNLQREMEGVGKALNEILKFFDRHLGSSVVNTSRSNADLPMAENMLAINLILRSFLLNDDGSLYIDPSFFSTTKSQSVFKGSDCLTGFNVTLDQVRLYGFDSITRFNSFRNIGKYTLQNELTWDWLKFEFDITLDIRPSRLDDAILMKPSSPSISESFTIDFMVNNIDVETSFFVLLDEAVIRSMKLGSLFNTKNLLPCLLSVIHEFKLSGLDVYPSYVNDGPNIDGFLTSGLDRVISESVEAVFAMYKGSLRTAIPNIFQTKVRELINTFIIDAVVHDTTGSKCPEVQLFGENLIDFRKLFDRKDTSYGDVPFMLKKMVDDELLKTNPETGILRINEAVIAPFTGAQSGHAGTMVFPIDLFSFLLPKTTSKKFGLETLEFRIFDPKVENLDTIGTPIQILEPNATYGQVLDNYASFGSGERKLRIGFNGLIAIEGDPTFTMNNQLETSVELGGSDAWVSLMANVDASSLLNFPLRDITNLQCWLHTLATPETIDERYKVGFSIVNAFLTIKSTTCSVACATCTSSSLSILPEILSSFKAFGVSDVVKKQIVKLILDLFRSDYSQGLINKILMDAAIRCPHSSKFKGSSASFWDISTMEFPTLDYKSLETVVFVSIVAIEVAVVVMAHAHEPYDLETTFPLSEQKNISVRNDARLVDFTSLETSLKKGASSTIVSFISSLNEIFVNPFGVSSQSILRFNSLIRSLLLDENKEFSMIVNMLDLEKLGMGISIKEVIISGLDSVTELNIFEAVRAQTIQNKIIWEDIRVQAVLSLEGPTASQSLKEQEITISAGFSDVSLAFALFTAIDIDLFDSLEMWSIMELKNILPCIVSTTVASSFTELELSVGSITDFSIVGFDSNEVSFYANQSSILILENYSDKIIASLPKVFDSTVRTLLNNWLKYQVDDFPSGLCKHSVHEHANNSKFVDLRDLLFAPSVANQLGGTGTSQYGDTFRFAMGRVQDIFKVDGATGLSKFNEIVVEPLIDSKGNEPGTIDYVGDLLTGEERIKIGGLDINVQFRAYDAQIKNMNTIGAPLDLFGGILEEAYTLNNTLTVGVGKKPLEFSSKIALSLKGDAGIDISNAINLSLELTNANVIFSSLAKIANARLFAFPLSDVFDLNCWLATIPAPDLDPRGVRYSESRSTASVSHLEAYIGELTLKAKCISCTSPRMTELTDLLSSLDAQNETTSVANALLDYVTQLISGNLLQVQLDRAISEAAFKCPHSPIYDPSAKPDAYEDFEVTDTVSPIGHLILLAVIALTIVIIVLTTAVTVKCIVSRRHRKWLMGLPPHQVNILTRHQKSKQVFEEVLNTTTRSMFRSPDVPCIIRFMIPLVIICNIFLFLSGHLSLGATVRIEAEIAGEKFTIEKFFEFSMARSTIDIWNAGGQQLAILILIFSGIWPYTKLLITLWLWFAPPSDVSISRRGSILLWLDWLAKWSMIDIFVMVISIAAFRVSIVSPRTSYLPDNFYAIEMMVIPLWGLYANMIAQLVSQITSHVIIYFHRRIIAKATDRLKQNIPKSANSQSSTETRVCCQYPENPHDMIRSCTIDIRQEQFENSSHLGDMSVQRSASESATECTKEQSTSLNSVQFGRPHRGETEKLIVRNYVNNLLLFCVFSSIICVTVGCILPSFSLELYGIVGVAVEFGQDFEEATFNHTVFSVIRLLFNQAYYLGTTRDYLGLIVLSLLFISTILFVPIIQSFTLLRQWTSNSTEKQKRKTAVRLEMLQAWQYLEVYLVALFLSSWQLGRISDFMINSYCKNLENTFAQMVYYGILKEKDAQCFGVTSRFGSYAFVLVSGAFLLSFLSSFVCKATLQYLRDDTHPELGTKGKDKYIIRIPDDMLQPSHGDTVDDIDITTNIRNVPVLFTDTFRWMLKSDITFAPSNRAHFVDLNNTHWSLPEATIVESGKYSSDCGMTKDAHVHSLVSIGEANVASSIDSPIAAPGYFNKVRQGLINLVTRTSLDSYQYERREKELSYDHNNQNQLKNERGDFVEQQSISSRMSFVGSSSNSASSIASDSPIHSTNTNDTIKALQAEVMSEVRYSGSLRRAPPLAAYRLSRKSLKEPHPSSSSDHDVRSTHQNRDNTKKQPPLSY